MNDIPDLRGLRKAAGLTQVKLAELIGTHAPVIVVLERCLQPDGELEMALRVLASLPQVGDPAIPVHVSIQIRRRAQRVKNAELKAGGHISVATAALRLGVTRQRVDQLIQAGQLAAYSVGTRTWIDGEDVNQLRECRLAEEALPDVVRKQVRPSPFKDCGLFNLKAEAGLWERSYSCLAREGIGMRVCTPEEAAQDICQWRATDLLSLLRFGVGCLENVRFVVRQYGFHLLGDDEAVV